MTTSHDNETSNPSTNRTFGEIVAARHSRRNVLKGSLALATTTFFATEPALAHFRGRRHRRPLIDFTPVPLAAGNGPMPAISEDYEWSVLQSWGDPIQPSGPAFRHPPIAAEQEQQIGIGHDGMTFFPASRYSYHSRGYAAGGCFSDPYDGRSDRGILCLNNEFGDNQTVIGKATPESLEDVRVSQAAHGVTVVEIAKRRGGWRVVHSQSARRIHGNTPVRFSGPVAGHPLLDTPSGNAPAGTLNNCANGQTPWGTYLTCEENFNGYFGATGQWEPTPAQSRYGFSAGGSGYGWELFDPRFDVSDPNFRNEENRFGWIVEIDPVHRRKMPVKRTALGRFKHEGIALTVGRGGRVVGYMGDDERFDYIYKFVSDGNWRKMLAKGKSPLDHGKLYVARFYEDGTGEWLELTYDNPVLAAAFADQAEILTFARMAADLLGATPMDRPEWTSVAPNGDVYCTCTNNSNRSEVGPGSPLAPNPDGHIIRWRDSDDHVGTSFEWDIFLVAADTHGTEESFADPDGIWVDPDHRVFIQTDGGQKDGLNNQMLVADPRTKEIRRLFTGVTGDEITGIAYTPDRRTMFINIQHPGNGDPSVTNFPLEPDGVSVPRDSTLVITRKDGGIIGS